MSFHIHKTMHNALRYANLGTKNRIKDNVQRGTAGQDSWLIYQFPDEPLLAVIVADGHGRHGQIYSRLTIDKVLESLKEVSIDVVITKEYQIGLLNNINTYLDTTTDCSIGGTTCSFVIIKKEDTQTKVYLSYVGDSPIYAKINGSIKMLGGDDSWDNRESVERYLTYCKEREIIPRRVIYSRINSLSGPDFSPWGLHGVVPVYDYDMETCKVTLNYDNYLKVAKVGYPHGTQTLEKYPTHKEVHDTHWGKNEISIADPGYEDCGWGNTLEGDLQVRTSLGDFIQGENTPCDPIYKEYIFDLKSIFSEPIQIGVMSDGWDDFGSASQVMDLLDRTKGGNTIKIVSDHIRAINPERVDEFLYNGQFKHDDVTAILVE